MQLRADPQLLVGFLLATVRVGAWLFVVPPFSSRMVPIPVKTGLAAAIGLLLADRYQGSAVDLTTWDLVGLVLYQAAIGLTLGLVVAVLFSAVQAAGSLIDVFAAFTSGAIYDPVSGAAATPMARLYQVLAVTLLFATGGHLLLLGGLVRTTEAAPLEGFPFDRAGEVLLSSVGTFFVAAVQIALPLLAALFLTEIALGLLTRAAPQLNVMIVGFGVKSVVLIALAGVALPLLPFAVERLVGEGVDAMRAVVGG